MQRRSLRRTEGNRDRLGVAEIGVLACGALCCLVALSLAMTALAGSAR